MAKVFVILIAIAALGIFGRADLDAAKVDERVQAERPRPMLEGYFEVRNLQANCTTWIHQHGGGTASGGCVQADFTEQR